MDSYVLLVVSEMYASFQNLYLFRGVDPGAYMLVEAAKH